MDYTPNQLEAINCLDKNLQIIACAGSGKTQVISQRIVNIIKDGKSPSSIIAFTYTEKAAGELQARILKLCREQIPAQTGIAEMYVGTIHAWCLNVLQEYKYEYQKYAVLDEIKLKLFVDRRFNEIGMKSLDMERFKDTGYFIQLMGILREADFHDYSAIDPKLLIALEQYQTVLRRHCYLDFTMIMTEVIRFLSSDPNFRKRIQQTCGFLIVDEYQDVNPIQEQIVRNIYELGANVCVVGDDDQTIFQWRGSSIDYIQHFATRYDNVHQVVLDDNFRSSKAVVDVALKCITNNTSRLPKQMIASGHQIYERGDLLYNQFDTVEEENRFIIQSIKNLRGSAFQDKPNSEPRGLDYSDFAILLRKWKKAGAIIQALQEANIPFIVTGVNNLFDRLEIQAAQCIFTYLNDQFDEGSLLDIWCSLSSKINPSNVQKAIEFLKKNKPKENGYYEAFIIQKIYQEFLDIAGIREEQFDGPENGSGAAGFNPEEIVFYNLGMFSRMIDDFETIYFRSDPKYKLGTFLNFLRYSADGYYPEGWLNNTYRTPNAIRIMTVYQAKGLEYPVAFIPGLNQNYLPTSQPGGRQVWHFINRNLIKNVERYFPAVEDERRLLYVAITRSKKFLMVSRAPDGRMQGRESAFAREIRQSEYIFSNTTRDYTERSHIEPKSEISLSNIALNFSLLKSFFDCPYSFKFYSFYGFRQPLSARLGFGASIHNSLMELHREYLDGNAVRRDELLALLDRHINFPYATDTIQDQMKQRAQKSVETYFDQGSDDFPNIEFAEKKIQLDLGDGVLVNGKMDLIKRKDQDGTEERTIIDFKSAEDAQTYNATKDQLQLYALGYQALTGTNADFLQIYNLDTNDGSKFELTKDDMNAMRLRIVDAANLIRTNQLDHTCNNPECVCRYKSVK